MTARLPDRLRVAVIGGGANCEHEVSLASAAAARTALAARGHRVVALTIGRDGCWHGPDGARLGISAASGLAAAVRLLEHCDVVLPVVHGPLGEDGALAALCALAQVPYVGSPLRAGALAMDKWATKLVAQALGIATAPGRLVTAATAADLRFTGPVVVKPVAAGSSHGVRRVDRACDLAPALAAALALDDRVLVEQVVVGREIDVAILDHPDGTRRIAPPLEIALTPGDVFDTDRKYDGSAAFLIPAPLADDQVAQLERAAVALFDALGCRGLARVDFFLTADGLVLNEVNTMPGMTPTSQVPQMFAADGLAYPELMERLVRDAAAVTAPRVA